MKTNKENSITVACRVAASIEKVWEFWSTPKHIIKWCQASEDWHAPHAENDLRKGGKFVTTMAAKDGSASFDFGGIYSEVIPNKSIKYTMDDGRQVRILFDEISKNEVQIEETFEPETMNSREMQQQGWQSILNSFKNYVETH